MNSYKKVLLTCVIIPLFSVCSFSENKPGEDILILSHTGASEAAPENTLAAFRAAKDAGADGFETDVRMTKDHQLVIHHDDAIQMTSDGQGLISEMTLNELKEFDFGSWFGEAFKGEKILTLEECLEEAKKLDFDVVDLELKSVAASLGKDETAGEDLENQVYVKAAADAIRESGFADHVLVTSFDSSLLEMLKKYMPEIPVGIITVPDMSFLTMFNLSKYLPEEKPLAEYEEEDVKDVPGMVSMILKGFGAKGRTPEETLLEAIHAVAAATPAGTTYSELKEMLQQEADIAGFVGSLDFPLEYVICHYKSLSEELLEAMHKQGKGVMAWTPDEDKDLVKVLSFSPEGIITNRPEAAVDLTSH